VHGVEGEDEAGAVGAGLELDDVVDIVGGDAGNEVGEVFVNESAGWRDFGEGDAGLGGERHVGLLHEFDLGRGHRGRGVGELETNLLRFGCRVIEGDFFRHGLRHDGSHSSGARSSRWASLQSRVAGKLYSPESTDGSKSSVYEIDPEANTAVLRFNMDGYFAGLFAARALRPGAGRRREKALAIVLRVR
jgi:hypothetical protein